jgi:hypothetical protein
VYLNIHTFLSWFASLGGKKGEKGEKVERKRSKGSARSRASSSGGRKSPAAGKKGLSESKSDTSDHGSEVNAADYVPVVREAILGMAVYTVDKSLWYKRTFW